MNRSNRVDTILFDLDGTLLPLDMQAFTEAYFKALGEKAAEHGYNAEKVISTVWAATKAMIKNDGSKSNLSCFWDAFAAELGEDTRKIKEPFDAFYQKEFHEIKMTTKENPLARPLVDKLKEKGFTLALATNPVFPLSATQSRLSWIGLTPSDFSHITSYENASFCKPSIAYYKEILSAIGKNPQQCIMVGNDAVEDLAAAKLGIDVYLVTDCLCNGEGEDLSCAHKGGFAQIYERLLALPPVAKQGQNNE